MKVMLASVSKPLLMALSLFMLAACGGGGGVSRDTGDDPGDPTPTPVTLSIALSLVDADGNNASNLDSNSPLTVRATVTNQGGDAVEGELVTFSFNPAGLAIFGNDSGTAVTDASGVAIIPILVGQDSGGGVVIGTIGDVEGQVGFTSAGTVEEQDTPTSLQLFASSPQLSSSGSDEIELTAIVKNEQNVLLEGITVNFSANEGAAIALRQPVTDADGIATAVLRTNGNRENRAITATAEVTDGVFLSEDVDVAVVGTEITLNTVNSVIIGAQAGVSIRLEDSDNQGIADQNVVLTVFNENDVDVSQDVLSVSNIMTDDTGSATVQFESSGSGVFTIFASALNAQSNTSVTVQRDNFSFLNPPDIENVEEDIPLNTDFELTVQWLIESAPFADGAINFKTSRGDIVLANTDTVTNANGEAVVTVRSDNAGQANVTATGTDSENRQVSASITIAFIATQADSITVNATPDAIGPDGQTATISAVVRDPVGNLVRNTLINFSVDDSSNGDLIEPTSTVTDRRGIATAIYRSNSVSGSENVIITATVDDTPTVTASTELTVGDRPFDISIGTGNLISSPNDSTYSKEFSAFVTDADSNPVANTQLTFRAPPVPFTRSGVYRKGTWFWVDDPGVWVPLVSVECPNEDINGNGQLDEGEDENGDMQLTPGNVVTVSESAQTDANGQALFDITYARQFGVWTEVLVEASGQSGGSEASESQYYQLGVSAADLQDEASQPPNSPYGVGMLCTDDN